MDGIDGIDGIDGDVPIEPAVIRLRCGKNATYEGTTRTMLNPAESS